MWIFDWQKPYNQFVEHGDNKAHPGLCEAGKWRVWNGEQQHFEIDSKVELISLTAEQYSQKQKELKNLVKAPSYMLVSGREGYNHEMNGLYCRIQKDWEGKAQYVEPKNNFYLRWHPGENSWIFDWVCFHGCIFMVLKYRLI